MHRRTWLLLPAGVSLLAGLDAALLLLEVPAPVDAAHLPTAHGILMVLGFLGTLISLERAVALRSPWAYAAPALLAIGAIAAVTPVPLPAAQAATVAGLAVHVLQYRAIWRRQPMTATAVQALGAAAGLLAAVAWCGGVPPAPLVPLLAAFLVLTIAGERLELARLAMGSGAGGTLVALAGGLMAAVAATLLWPATTPLLGLAVVALTGWLAHHDVARRTIRGTGLVRFMAAAMLGGYAWLVVAGLVWLLRGQVLTGAAYDAAVHAVFLGFTLSMIMAHAPVILPAVLRRPLPYHPLLWVPFALLHASLVVRLWLGGALLLPGAWRAGGVTNVLAVLLFVGVAAWRVLSARSRADRRTP